MGQFSLESKVLVVRCYWYLPSLLRYLVVKAEIAAHNGVFVH